MKLTARLGILLLAAVVAGAAGLGLLWLRLERRLQTETTAQEARWYPSVWRESPPIAPERGIRLWLANGPVRCAARYGARQIYGGGMGLLVRDGDGAPCRRLTVLDGLPVERVESLAVLGDHLYIGTGGGGLTRWDGRRFETFCLPAMADAWVTALAGTSGGTLLAATRQGYLLEFGADSFRFIPTPGVPAGGFSRVLPAGRGFFLGTYDHGLYLGDNGRCRPLLTRQHPFRMVTDLARLPGGQILAGTDAGLFVLSPRGDFQERLFADRMVTMVSPAGDRLLCACLEDALYHASLAGWTAGRRTFHRFGMPDAVQGATAMARGAEIFTARGVYRLAPGARPDQIRLEPLPLPPGELERPSAMTMAGDGRRGLWLGYFDGGLEERAPDGARRRMLTPPDLACVNHLAWQGGALWAGTARGAWVCRPGGCEPVGGPESPLRTAYINQVLPLSGGAWGIAHGAGFSILSGGEERLLYVRHGLPSNKIYCAAQRGATLYLGTLGGLAVLERDRVTAVFQADNSRLRVNWITALLPCAQGLVVGTYGGGAQLLGPAGVWDEFAGVDPRLGINPNALCAVGSWVLAGSLAQGVWLLDPATRRGRRLDLPLPARSVQAILVAGQTLYISTENGVVVAPLATANLDLEKSL